MVSVFSFPCFFPVAADRILGTIPELIRFLLQAGHVAWRDSTEHFIDNRERDDGSSASLAGSFHAADWHVDLPGVCVATQLQLARLASVGIDAGLQWD